MRSKVVAVVGPTASGKSSLALRIAEESGIACEIVGVDSMQVYRGMDIGTAKPSASERALCPHHLIDVAAPGEAMDARRYADLASAAVDDILSRGALPLLVGGTGLWLRALLHGLMPAPPAVPAVRARLEAEATPTLRARLSDVDPAAAERIHAHDRVRTIRALEVFELTGLPISAHQAAHDPGPPAYDALLLGIRWPRKALYARIDARTDAMFEGGFVEEVRGLLAAGVSRTLRPMGALGYKHVCAALAGEIDEEEARLLTRRDTRRYAKRQETWFKKLEGLVPLDGPPDVEAACALVREFLGRDG